MIAGALYADSLSSFTAHSSLRAVEKRDILWQMVEDSAYVGALPTEAPGGLELLGGLSASYLQTTFLHASDTLPFGRKKLVHPYGSVAAVELRITDPSRASGVLASGGVGLLRLSLASLTGPFSPGLALKILIDGAPSVNFLAGYSLDGQPKGDHRFFENTLTNILPQPTQPLLLLGQLAFRNALATLPNAPVSELNLPLDEACAVRSNGVRESAPRVPWQIHFVPMGEAREIADAETESDFRERLARLPAGATLYTVYVQNGGKQRAYPIGVVRMKSGFVASEFGDQRLFFKHQRRM